MKSLNNQFQKRGLLRPQIEQILRQNRAQTKPNNFKDATSYSQILLTLH